MYLALFLIHTTDTIMEKVSAKTEEERKQMIESAAQIFVDLILFALDEASSSKTDNDFIGEK